VLKASRQTAAANKRQQQQSLDRPLQLPQLMQAPRSQQRQRQQLQANASLQPPKQQHQQQRQRAMQQQGRVATMVLSGPCLIQTQRSC
jgi:hypothetical protein